jgi:hypothetical protein
LFRSLWDIFPPGWIHAFPWICKHRRSINNQLILYTKLPRSPHIWHIVFGVLYPVSRLWPNSTKSWRCLPYRWSETFGETLTALYLCLKYISLPVRVSFLRIVPAGLTRNIRRDGFFEARLSV